MSEQTTTQRAVEDIKDRVAWATVYLPWRRGQGVLVPGGYILTAASCISSRHEGWITLCDDCLEFETRGEFQLVASPCAIEPVADIVVLEALDREEFFPQAAVFGDFCANTEPVPVRPDPPALDETLRVHILAQTGEWVTGTVTLHGGICDPWPGCAWLTADAPLAFGASGGPVVDEAGRLVGVIPGIDHDAARWCVGQMPLACRALPTWVWDRICRATRPLRPAGSGCK